MALGGVGGFRDLPVSLSGVCVFGGGVQCGVADVAALRRAGAFADLVESGDDRLARRGILGRLGGSKRGADALVVFGRIAWGILTDGGAGSGVDAGGMAAAFGLSAECPATPNFGADGADGVWIGDLPREYGGGAARRIVVERFGGGGAQPRDAPHGTADRGVRGGDFDGRVSADRKIRGGRRRDAARGSLPKRDAADSGHQRAGGHRPDGSGRADYSTVV